MCCRWCFAKIAFIGRTTLTGIHIAGANGGKTKHQTRTISVLPGKARNVGEVGMKKDFIVRRSITMVEGKPPVETYSEQVLVRCKDCKHRNEANSPYWEIWCERNDRGVDRDWFCADGQRKEG